MKIYDYECKGYKFKKEMKMNILREADILREAGKIINGERQDQYGKPEDSFQIIADFWTTYLGTQNDLQIPLIAVDVAHMMALFKIARMLGQKKKRDNYVDACGYLAITADRLMNWENNENEGI